MAPDNYVLPDVSTSAWPSATAIADELVRSGTGSEFEPDIVKVVAAVAPRVVGPHTPEYVRVTESPASPDSTEDFEARSESSDTPEVVGIYRPTTSPVTDVSGAEAAPTPLREMGPSAAQEYWLKLQRRRGQMVGYPYNKIAVVRPRPRPRPRRMPAMSRRDYPQLIRILTRAPVVRSVSILSQVTSPGGHVATETLNDLINLARTRATQTPPRPSQSMATQTFTPLFADVHTSTGNGGLPANVVVIRLGGVATSGEAPATVTTGEESTSGAEAVVMATENAEDESATGDESGTEGTPLMDE